MAGNQLTGKSVPALVPTGSRWQPQLVLQRTTPAMVSNSPVIAPYTHSSMQAGMAPFAHSQATGLSLLSVSCLGSPILCILYSQCWLTSLATTACFYFLPFSSSLNWEHMNGVPSSREKRIERRQRPIVYSPKTRSELICHAIYKLELIRTI